MSSGKAYQENHFYEYPEDTNFYPKVDRGIIPLKYRKEEICLKCGETYIKVRYNQKYCHECGLKRSQPKNRCACGRILRNPDTICSFCISIERTIKRALVHSVRNPTICRCSKCKTEIPNEDFKMFDGLCAFCYAKKVRIEGI